MSELIYHDSRDLFYRNPFGAVSEGTEITIRATAAPDAFINNVFLRTWDEQKGEEIFEMNRCNEVFTACIKAPDHPGLLWYYFIVNCPGEVWYYGNNRGFSGGAGEKYPFPSHSFQVSVFKKGFSIPDWFKDGIIYQIFPDRFCRAGELPAAPANCVFHRDWYEQPFYTRCPDGSDLLASDYFGGNFEGIISKLDYISSLGCTVIYLNPVFRAASNHRYNTGNYMETDPLLGSNEIFSELCREAGKRGIRIILDGVFSHTGSDSLYFNKEGSYPSPGAFQSLESPYFKWYTFTEFPDVYDCWWGIRTLPNVNELEKSYLDFIHEVVSVWRERGASGWRLDVADELPEEFLKIFRSFVKSGEQVIIGEVWEDASNKVSYGQVRQYFSGEMLDSVMNYPLREALIRFALGQWDGGRLHTVIMSLYENYPAECFHSLMNLLGSHDVARIRTILGKCDLYPEGTRCGALTQEESDKADALLKLLSLFIYSFPGVPSIYYGDEAGLEGGRDPYNRGTYPWGRENGPLVEWFRLLGRLRNDFPVLRRGEFIPLLQEGDVYGFARVIPEDRGAYGRPGIKSFALAVFNRGAGDIRVEPDLSRWGLTALRDAIKGDLVYPGPRGIFNITLPQAGGRLFISIDEDQN